MAKQGDSDAHDACGQLSEAFAVAEKGLLGWKECCREALKDFAGDARSSPPAESGFASKETRRVCIKFTTHVTITYRPYNQRFFIRF